MISMLASLVNIPVFAANGDETQTNETQVDGTSGVPLGGFGTGGVKFNAHRGTFAALTKAPADAYDYSSLDAKFQLYTNRNDDVETVDTMRSVVTDGRSDDDAIWPMHYANMDSTNDVQVNLKRFRRSTAKTRTT